MQEDIRQILIPRETIQQRVHALAVELAAHYAAREITLVPLLTGSIIFVADLVRHLPLRMKIDVLAVSSYRGTVAAGARVLYPTTFDVAGKHVLVIDDILDTGNTLQTVTALLRTQNAASVRSCVLLQKMLPVPPAIAADYVGFPIPDEFVVGYGLDYCGYYRNLPDIAVLHRHVLEKKA